MVLISVFDNEHRPQLQKDILSGSRSADDLLPDLREYVKTEYVNIFKEIGSENYNVIPVSRRGNKQWAFRQSIKKSYLTKILKKKIISYEDGKGGIFSNLFFMTLTIDHKKMSSAKANYFITTKGQGLNKFFARLNKHIKGGYSKVLVKESTMSGYPAVHILLYLNKPLKVYWHVKSSSYRLDVSDGYTRSVLGSLKNLNDWNSISPMWEVGYIDIKSFVNDNLSIKGYANPINYISKYITKSLKCFSSPDLSKCQKVSELPEKYRTAVWTILNNLIWNSQTWVISNHFKKALSDIKKNIVKNGSWEYIGTFLFYSMVVQKYLGYDKYIEFVEKLEFDG